MATAQLTAQQQIKIVSVKVVDKPWKYEVVVEQEDGKQQTLTDGDILVVTTKVELGDHV